MDMERIKFRKAVEALSVSALQLSNAWAGLSEADMTVLHIDAIHEDDDDCVACKVFSRLYSGLFTTSFDEWAYKLSDDFLQTVQERTDKGGD